MNSLIHFWSIRGLNLNQSLRARRRRSGLPAAVAAQPSSGDKPKFTEHWRCTRGMVRKDHGVAHGATGTIGPLTRWFEQTTKGGMMKKLLVSVVDDDRFFRESLRRLMRSLGYTVEAFPSAADFLASPRLPETACLFADIHMPAMSGLELYRHLADAGRAIPTVLVTAYPNDADRARALNDGVMCYLRKPVVEDDLKKCLSTVLRAGGTAAGDS